MYFFVRVLPVVGTDRILFSCVLPQTAHEMRSRGWWRNWFWAKNLFSNLLMLIENRKMYFPRCTVPLTWKKPYFCSYLQWRINDTLLNIGITGGYLVINSGVGEWAFLVHYGIELELSWRRKTKILAGKINRLVLFFCLVCTWPSGWCCLSHLFLLFYL